MEITKSLLEHLYLDLAMSCAAISDKTKASEETIRRLLIAHGIPRRPKTCRFGGHNKGKPMPKFRRKLLSEKRKALYASGQLRHWNKGGKWPKETRKKISESLLNGRTPAPSFYGADWRLQRTSCLQRDGHACQQCFETKNLEVHHWEPYRFSFDNSLENLVTLCDKCHNQMHALYRKEGFILEAEEAMYG